MTRGVIDGSMLCQVRAGRHGCVAGQPARNDRSRSALSASGR